MSTLLTMLIESYALKATWTINIELHTHDWISRHERTLRL